MMGIAEIQKANEPKRERHEIVCVALAITTKDTLRPVFREIDEHGALDERELIWGSVKHAAPGNVYSVETDVDGWKGEARSIYCGKGGRLDFVREWPNEADRDLWETIGRTARIAFDSHKRREKAESHNALKKLAAPLARIYDRLPYGQRAPFLVELQHLVTSMRRGDS